MSILTRQGAIRRSTLTPAPECAACIRYSANGRHAGRVEMPQEEFATANMRYRTMDRMAQAMPMRIDHGHGEVRP